MKKAVLRKLIEMSEKVIGKEETDKIIDETVKETLEEIKPKKKDTKDKKAKDELDKYNTVLSNIENYDGTSNNQKEV